jgi:PPOX class probable F420-dependent enzyme
MAEQTGAPPAAPRGRGIDRPWGSSLGAVAEQMTREEWHAFVIAGTRTGKFAVPRKSGAPHVLPVWFVLEGDDFLFTTGRDTVRGRSLRRDGRGCMLVDEELPPYAFLKAEGRAELSDEPEGKLRVATLVGARYMGEDRAEEFARRNAVPEEMLVRFTPERVFGQRGVAE